MKNTVLQWWWYFPSGLFRPRSWCISTCSSWFLLIGVVLPSIVFSYSENVLLPDIDIWWVFFLWLFLFIYYFFMEKSHFFSFTFISWRLISLQYCSGFCHTLTWISHGLTCVPHPDPPSRLPPHRIPLGLPSAPAPSTHLMHPTWAGGLFHPW